MQFSRFGYDLLIRVIFNHRFSVNFAAPFKYSAILS